MREETRRDITEQFYGDADYVSNNPFFDMLLDTIENEIDFAQAEAVARERGLILERLNKGSDN